MLPWTVRDCACCEADLTFEGQFIQQIEISDGSRRPKPGATLVAAPRSSHSLQPDAISTLVGR